MRKETVTIRGFVTTEEEVRQAEKELEEQFGALWVATPEYCRQRLIVAYIQLKLENARRANTKLE
jgi:hypothetical protein